MYRHKPLSLYLQLQLQFVFERNVIVRLFSEPFSVSSEAIVFLVDPYY